MANVFVNIEPYHTGTCFRSWAERLKYFFIANKIENGKDKIAYLITIGGSVIFSQLKLMYSVEYFDNVPYDELISNLITSFDKCELDMIQRLRFNTRNQQPNESYEDYLLSLRYQAELCGFGVRKDQAILDRIVAGVLDDDLRSSLLNEYKLTLVLAEKILETWEMATTNSKPFSEKEDEVFAMKSLPGMGRGQVIQRMKDFQESRQRRFEERNRIPVKNRLGYKRHDSNYRKRVRFDDARRYEDVRPAEYRSEQPKWDQRICDFCGLRGHVARKCYKKKNQHKYPVNRMDIPGSSKENISNLLGRMNTKDSDDELDGDSDTDSNWKRSRSRTPHSAQNI
ncbi:uncharacterized protein LOC131438615 [Malaya genurostris]|uniref:uncharacterized protein LOC131438615 n=1 Tax=Malaya genurostris TaxID=325434 RepID=UPI0026F39B6F|nr:uncharacterized protein LOC131438615 [Malaya genurostris]